MGKGVGGRIAVVLAVGAVAAIAAVPGSGAVPTTPGVVYAGETPQFEVVTAEVNRLRNQVVKFQFGWSASCVLGPAATPTTQTGTAFYEYRGGYPINKLGRWTKNFNRSETANGNTRKFVYRLNGVRTALKMSGTIRVTMTETDATGAVVRTCDTKQIKYSAPEKSRFGGLTVGLKSPVVVNTNPALTRIQRIRWDWTATCTAGPAAKPDTVLDEFQQDFIQATIVAKPNGTFTKSFQYEPQPDQQSGTTRAYTNSVTGRVVGRTIKGTLTGSFTETETATGVVIRTCKSGPVKFNTKD